jgi:glycosyltransferase involved in cell wall biosynthesis
MVLRPILFVIDATFPREFGPADFFENGSLALSGTNSANLLLAQALTERGHSVGILLRGWDTRYEGIAFHHFKTSDDVAAIAADYGSPCVVINSSNIEPLPLELCQMARFPGKRILWDQIFYKGEFIRSFRQHKLSHFVQVSYYQREFFRSCSTFRATSLIYNLASRSLFAQRSRDIDFDCVLFVGALIPQKGFDALVAAWPHVVRENPQARLVVAGSSALHFHQEARGPLGLSSTNYEAKVLQPFLSWCRHSGAKVDFLGSVSRADLVVLQLHAACCVVNPRARSTGESFCSAAAEAQLIGIPVVSTGPSVLNETTLPRDGSLLVQEDSPQNLANAILSLMRNPKMNVQMGTNARVTALQKFDRSIIIDAWSELIQTNFSRCEVPHPEVYRSVPAWLRLQRNLLRLTGLGDERRIRRDRHLYRVNSDATS